MRTGEVRNLRQQLAVANQQVDSFTFGFRKAISSQNFQSFPVICPPLPGFNLFHSPISLISSDVICTQFQPSALPGAAALEEEIHLNIAFFQFRCGCQSFYPHLQGRIGFKRTNPSQRGISWPTPREGLMKNRISVLHLNSGGIGKSTPSALEISLSPFHRGWILPCLQGRIGLFKSNHIV